MSALEQAIREANGASKLAAEIGVTIQRLSNWQGRRVPAEYCPAIERATGGKVLCEHLRPDIDWAYLRGTEKRGTARASA